MDSRLRGNDETANFSSILVTLRLRGNDETANFSSILVTLRLRGNDVAYNVMTLGHLFASFSDITSKGGYYGFFVKGFLRLLNGRLPPFLNCLCSVGGLNLCLSGSYRGALPKEASMGIL